MLVALQLAYHCQTGPFLTLYGAFHSRVAKFPALPCRAALASFKKIGMQMGAVQQLAESATAAMAFGLDRRGDQKRLEGLSKRLGQLQQVPLSPLQCWWHATMCFTQLSPTNRTKRPAKHARALGVDPHGRCCLPKQAYSDALAAFAARVPRPVPVSYYGVASEVRLMGDFDGWTQGFALSAEEISDDVFTRFEGQALLPPVRRLVLTQSAVRIMGGRSCTPERWWCLRCRGNTR